MLSSLFCPFEESKNKNQIAKSAKNQNQQVGGLGRLFPHDYIVLLSAKLQISAFPTNNKILLMNILNNNGLNIEPCGILRQISDHLLYEEPALVLWFFKLS